MTSLISRKALWAALLALVVALAVTLLARPATAASHQSDRPGGPVINWALSGQASAGASQAADPPANAIDGDGATAWCTNSWPDTLTVDLGQVRNLDGVGLTLDTGSSSAKAAISLATQPGAWQPVASATNFGIDPGNPMYVPLRPTRARFAQIEVWDVARRRCASASSGCSALTPPRRK